MVCTHALPTVRSVCMLYLTIRREVSQEQYEQLKLELFKAILTYAQGPRIVRSKLCVTVIIFFVMHRQNGARKYVTVGRTGPNSLKLKQLKQLLQFL